MSEALGKLSFWLMFVGFNLTFLVQHSAGLSGMPRRIYDYSEDLGVTTYNLISTIGAFILGIGVVVTCVNVIVSIKKGKRAGNDPWKGNTLEWFTSSPPAANNFDVIPRVRSVEPMKDIRREVLAGSEPAETVAQPAAPRSAVASAPVTAARPSGSAASPWPRGSPPSSSSSWAGSCVSPTRAWAAGPAGRASTAGRSATATWCPASTSTRSSSTPTARWRSWWDS